MTTTNRVRGKNNDEIFFPPNSLFDFDQSKRKRETRSERKGRDKREGGCEVSQEKGTKISNKMERKKYICTNSYRFRSNTNFLLRFLVCCTLIFFFKSIYIFFHLPPLRSLSIMLINKFSTFMEINRIYFNLMKIRGKLLITLFCAESVIEK
jgi:hypothetical protein